MSKNKFIFTDEFLGPGSFAFLRLLSSHGLNELEEADQWVNPHFSVQLLIPPRSPNENISSQSEIE